MAGFFARIIKSLEKFFKPFPHFSVKIRKILLPIIPWYLFIEGLSKLIHGLRSLSAGFKLGAIPRIFSRILDLNPEFLFFYGLFFILVGYLYLTAFTNLSQQKNQYLGWFNWFQATVLITIFNLYQVIFHHHSIFWPVITISVSWYFVFEFKKTYQQNSKK